MPFVCHERHPTPFDIPRRWDPQRDLAVRALRVAFADFSAAPWQGLEKSERCPNNSSLFRPQAAVVVVAVQVLLDRMSLSAKNGWLDEQGRVYIIYTVREVQESLCCAEHKVVKLFRELENIDLIERKRRGLGRPSLVYVKNFSSGLPKPQANKTDKNNKLYGNDIFNVVQTAFEIFLIECSKNQERAL